MSVIEYLLPQYTIADITLQICSMRIPMIRKTSFELFCQLTPSIVYNGMDKRVIIIQESFTLPRLGDSLAHLGQEGFKGATEPSKTNRDGLSIGSLAT